MPRPISTKSLLLLLSSAIAACGDGGTVLQTVDATADGAKDARPKDANGDTSIADGSEDVTAEVSDASSDACNDATDADGGCPPDLTVRRPFLIGHTMRASTARSREDWGLDLGAVETDVDPRTRRALADAYVRDGLEEHASIAAFARLTMHLLALGAPPDLVLRSQRAGMDEIHHARACFALAERYSGEAIGPSPLAIGGAMDVVTLAAIAELAAEEGCVGETLGAALANEQLGRATDPSVLEILAKLARDEARHAELAWAVVAWAVKQGGAPIADVVERAVRRAARETIEAPVRSYDGIDLEVWRAHGRVTCADARAFAEKAVAEVVMPALELVTASVRRPAPCVPSVVGRS